MHATRMTALLCLIGGAALGQESRPAESQPATQPATRPAYDLPEAVRELLTGVEDFGPRFDQPGFVPLLAFVKHSGREVGFAHGALEIDDWRDVLRRPSDFRGAPITVEGVVGGNKNWHFVDPRDRKRIGTVWQLQLGRDGQPLDCTVLLTSDATDIGLGSTIRVSGYFLMISEYLGKRKGDVGRSLVIVGRSPTMVSRVVPGTTKRESRFRWDYAVATVVGALLFAWMIMRRTAKSGRTNLQMLHAGSRAPLNLADDLDEWVEQEQTGEER